MQKKIVNEMKVKTKIDAKDEIKSRIEFIKEMLIETSTKSLVLGISGGQDSTLAGKLCQMAIEELGEEYTFFAVRLPYGRQLDEEDCQLALEFIKPSKKVTFDIKKSTDITFNTLVEQGVYVSDFNKGNIKARQRMVYQYALAASVEGLVVGTDHSSEAVTGFYTKFGDGGFDFSPLFGLNKRQGKQLLEYLNAPKQLYLKVPTADLEDNKPALADEVALGFTYDELDDYLEGKTVSKKVEEKIELLYKKTIHKRQMPYNPYHKIRE